MNEQLLIEFVGADDKPGIAVRAEPDGGADDAVAGNVHRDETDAASWRRIARPREHRRATADGETRGGKAGGS